MPVNPNLYPKNWTNIALSVKVAAGWQCQCCGKKCYVPGERPENLKRSEWTADTLQVHHRNHDPSQNQVSNLQAVRRACCCYLLLLSRKSVKVNCLCGKCGRIPFTSHINPKLLVRRVK